MSALLFLVAVAQSEAAPLSEDGFARVMQIQELTLKLMGAQAGFETRQVIAESPNGDPYWLRTTVETVETAGDPSGLASSGTEGAVAKGRFERVTTIGTQALKLMGMRIEYAVRTLWGRSPSGATYEQRYIVDRLKYPKPENFVDAEDRVPPSNREWRGAARRYAGGLLTYAAAFALKGIVTRDWEELRQLAEPGFWGAAALFGAASQTAETVTVAAASRVPAAVAQAVPKAAIGAVRLAQGGLYMAAGMAAVQYALTGEISLKDVAVSAASYMIAGAAVNLLVDGAMLLLLGATPAGWVYIVAKLALTLYFGEKLDAWIRSWWEGARERAAAWFAGVKPKIDAILEGR